MLDDGINPIRVVSGDWNRSIDILYSNDITVCISSLYILLKYFINSPYPYLIQVMVISKDLKVSTDFYRDMYIYNVFSISVLHKLDFSGFILWYFNSWNSHLGYKSQYSNVGFRLLFSCDDSLDYSHLFNINYPWDNSYIEKYGLDFKIRG